MSSEIAPCPWCEDGGKPFLHKGHHPFFHFAMKCTACGAQGPHVKFDHGDGRKRYEDIVRPVKEEATRLWNQQYVSLGDTDAESSEDAPDAVIAA